MAYEQFYTGYLLMLHINRSMIPLGTNFLDLKDRVGIFVKKAF